ncbi:MAG: response regulator [Acidobacteriota bacterium]|jgi:chemotaxis protein histidine kinase CheA
MARRPLDPELQELIPLFIDEVRDRLERLATFVPRLPGDAEATIQVKRELHTVKGAARMLQLGQIAELCHATEELVEQEAEGVAPLLTRVVDRLSGMVDVVSEGDNPEPETELLRLVTEASETGEAPPEVGEAGPAGKAGSKAAGKAGESTKTKKTKKTTKTGKTKKTGKKKTSESGTDAQTKSAGRKAAKPRPKKRAAAPADADPDATTVGVSEVDRTGDRRTAASAEQAAQSLLGGSDVRVDADALDAVADNATQVRILSLAARNPIQRIYDLARLAEDGMREEQPKQILAVLGTMLRRLAVDVESNQRRLLRSAEDGLDTLLTLQLQPLRGYLLHLARYARELGRSLGREVEVEIVGEETRLDRRIARELEESLLHLVRNSVDHGLEAASERKKAGKDPVGKLRLAAEPEAGRVRLTIADDGAGIEPEAVVRQAVRAGIVDAAAADSLTRDEIFRLLFTPGFSTRRKVSEISGRGVGLDVVASSVNRLGGEVFLSAVPGSGTSVVVEVPVARRGEQVMLIRLGRTRLALPSTPIRKVETFRTEDVLERDGRSFIQMGDRLVAFVPLSRVFGQQVPDEQLLLRGRVSGQPLALAVDSVEGEEEVLVRPVTRAVKVEQAVDGLALLASGDPIGVLSPAVLAKREFLRSTRRVVVEEEAVERVNVLLVDDSLVTREMERRLLEDAGFDVTAASDADEGLNYLGENEYDCVVTDIEMPGMNGYELTRHLRNIPRFSQLPIIVVSTRDRPEDRLEGLQAGADAYLTKQGLDAGELVDLVRRLSGER